MKYNRKGFTLVEIMVVVLIIGLLAALGTYKVRQAVTSGRNNGAGVELLTLATSTMQLAWDTGRWPNKTIRTKPGSTEIWDISVSSAGLMGTDGSYSEWKGPYYPGAKLDPWGNPYFFDPDYKVDGSMREVVGSFGANGKGRNLYDEDDIIVVLDTMELILPEVGE